MSTSIRKDTDEMSRSVRKSLYFNTMIFTIIAGVISLLLLAALAFGSDMIKTYWAFIVTIEIGLLAVIIVALVRIFAYEKKLKELGERGLNNAVSVDSCPDYWTVSETDGEKKQCIPQYVQRRDDGSTVTYQFSRDASSIKIDAYDGKKLDELCTQVSQLRAPWTDVRALCAAYSASQP